MTISYDDAKIKIQKARNGSLKDLGETLDALLDGDTTYVGGTAVTATAAELNDSVAGLTATSAEINRAADASARIVTTTATILALTITQHAERVVIVNTNSTVANTLTLPVATGSGAKFEVRNGIAQTQGSIVIAANGTLDTFKGFALGFDSTAVATHASFFVATATDDKVTWSRTTTGGVGQDVFEAIDEAANVWRVKVINNCSGAPATPFTPS
jgi:ABC-type enterochelin transport system substrate-binding protein